MKFLTQKQKLFLVKREIKKNGLYMFPAMGFDIYSGPSYLESVHMDTNPFTRSLAHEQFLVKDIENGFCRGNFYSKPHNTDFYLSEEELSRRGLIEMSLLFILTFIPFAIYNLFKGGN